MNDRPTVTVHIEDVPRVAITDVLIAIERADRNTWDAEQHDRVTSLVLGLRVARRGCTVICDAFLFAGETEMLELRYRTLRDVVDYMVPVVCSVTHQGDPVHIGTATRIPDCALGDPKMCEPYVVTPNNIPNVQSYTGRRFFRAIERQHRARVWEAVWARVQPNADDIVMVSDVDEIPDIATVPMLGAHLDLLAAQACVLQQRFHSDRLSLLHPQQPWLGTTVSRWVDCDADVHRQQRAWMWEQGYVVPDGGVHLSWMGTDEQREWKLHAICHGELINKYDPREGRARGLHANGEKLIECDFPGTLDWPGPLFDGSFPIPDSWL